VSEGSIVLAHGVACAVSRGNVSDFLRVVQHAGRRFVVMADGHTRGWDSGQIALSAPVLDAVVHALGEEPASPYRTAARSTTAVFDAARTAFLAAADAHPEDDTAGGPATQLAMLELEGHAIRASWLARMELAVYRGAIVHRVTREPSPAIERAVHTPSQVELAVDAGDVVTLCVRRWVGGMLDYARSDRLATLATSGASPEEITRAMLRWWKDEQDAARASGGLIGETDLIVAATRV
jgi:hypothetical protein